MIFFIQFYYPQKEKKRNEKYTEADFFIAFLIWEKKHFIFYNLGLF